MHDMKSLVTGGAGFIGSHLVDLLLKNGHEVTVLDNFSTGHKENLSHLDDQITTIECDISTQGAWVNEFKSIDYVFHLAALADIVPSIQNPEAYFRANVDGTFNVIDASKKASIKKLIYSASSSCYGIPSNYPTPESAEIKPQYPYALTKRLGEELVLHWSQIYDLPAISLRFFNVYGPRSRTSGTYGAVFGVFLAQKLAGKPYTIVGDGKQTRDFTFVSDITEALLSAADSNINKGIFNVGSGESISVNRITQLLGGESINIPKRPGEPDITFADINNIQHKIGWSPKVKIDQGIKILLENIEYWSKAPVWDPESIAIATKDWFEYLGKD